MPKISIIIPTYNSSKFIKRTINSVLNQTLQDWELLIVDDTSTDNTVELIHEFLKKDQRIRFYKTLRNSGAPALPKNLGIEKAMGEYIAFLDHDDEWLPLKLEKQLEIFESSHNEKLGVVSCFINIINNKNKLILKYKKNYKKDIIKNLVKKNFLLTSSCVMVKSIIFKKIGSFDSKFGISDDLDMWIRIATNSYDFDYVPEYLVNYISHGNNACYNANKTNKEECILMFEKHKDLFLKYHKERIGFYYFHKGNNKMARRYLMKNIFSTEKDFEERVKSIAFIILTYCPKLENNFRKIFSKIKNIL